MRVIEGEEGIESGLTYPSEDTIGVDGIPFYSTHPSQCYSRCISFWGTGTSASTKTGLSNHRDSGGVLPSYLVTDSVRQQIAELGTSAVKLPTAVGVASHYYRIGADGAMGERVPDVDPKHRAQVVFSALVDGRDVPICTIRPGNGDVYCMLAAFNATYRHAVVAAQELNNFVRTSYVTTKY